jgi:hypothetical protein
VRNRWMILGPALGLALAGPAAFAPARADCVSSCSTYAPGVYDWELKKQTCITQCISKQGSRTAYGALAYGARSTAWGFSYNQDSAAAAARVALDGCKPNGDDCKVVYDFSNTCAALAAVESKGVFATGYAPSRGRAEGAAMANCARQHGDGCEVEVSACSLP